MDLEKLKQLIKKEAVFKNIKLKKINLMNKWFIADTHFSHANIIKYTKRPFKNVDEMNHALIKNWNSLIDKNDIVFFLGDFGMGSLEQTRSRSLASLGAG